MAERRLGLVLQRHMGLVRCFSRSASSGRNASEAARSLRGLESILKKQKSIYEELRGFESIYEDIRKDQDFIMKSLVSMQMTLDMITGRDVEQVTEEEISKERDSMMKSTDSIHTTLNMITGGEYDKRRRASKTGSRRRDNNKE